MINPDLPSFDLNIPRLRQMSMMYQCGESSITIEDHEIAIDKVVKVATNYAIRLSQEQNLTFWERIKRNFIGD